MRLRILVSVIVLVLTSGFAGQAKADSSFIITLEQVGSNVVATGSGAIDLTGLTYVDSSGGGAPQIYPVQSDIAIGPLPSDYTTYTGITGPSSFGAGGFIFATSGTGDFVAVQGENDILLVPDGYVSGTTLSDSATWDNTTLSDLGVSVGTYTWTWDNGEDSATLYAGTTPAPHPSLRNTSSLTFWRRRA